MQAIIDAFDVWDFETRGHLQGIRFFGNADVVFADGVNTYSMRNLGGGGVLAATFITWSDTNDNNQIDRGEEFMEMDVIHNSTVKWAIAKDNPRGRWWDVQNVAVHELGHVYGLAHPGNLDEFDQDQTMFASAPPRETDKRSLELDGDVRGIQSTFLCYDSCP